MKQESGCVSDHYGSLHQNSPQSNMHLCLRLLSIAVVKIMNKNNLGREGIISPHSLQFIMQGTETQDIQGSHLETGTEALLRL